MEEMKFLICSAYNNVMFVCAYEHMYTTFMIRICTFMQKMLKISNPILFPKPFEKWNCKYICTVHNVHTVHFPTFYFIIYAIEFQNALISISYTRTLYINTHMHAYCPISLQKETIGKGAVPLSHVKKIRASLGFQLNCYQFAIWNN